MSALHHTNLHNHLRNGEVLKCPVDFGAAAVAAVVMANESWRTGQMMGWDEETQDMVPCHGRDQKLFSEDRQTNGLGFNPLLAMSLPRTR